MTENIDNNLRLRFHKSYEASKLPEDGRKRLLKNARNISHWKPGNHKRILAGIRDDIERLSGQLLHLALGNKEVNPQ